jgi:drug/metabolite transporter (DMT)-like permease
MPAAALALLVAAAFGHAFWNYLAKSARNDAAFTFAFVVCSLVVYAPVAAIAWAIERPSLGWEAFAFVAVSGGAFHIAYYYALTTGYRLGDLSVVYPLARGSGPAIAVAGGVLIYDERPSALALAGAALIIAGIIVMTWNRNGERLHRDARLSIGFALLTGAIIGTYTLWDTKGVDLSTPILYGYGIDVFRAAVFAPFVLGRRTGREALAYAWREERRAVVGIGILEPGAYMMVLAALTLAAVSYVAPAREMSILIGTMMGARLLGEADAPRRLAGATAIVAGVFALAFG